MDHEKDVSEATISLDDTNKEEEKYLFLLLSVSLTVNKRGEMEISGDTEEVELEKIASDIDASGKEIELGKETEQEPAVTGAVLVLEQIKKKEKTSLDQKR